MNGWRDIGKDKGCRVQGVIGRKDVGMDGQRDVRRDESMDVGKDG